MTESLTIDPLSGERGSTTVSILKIPNTGRNSRFENISIISSEGEVTVNREIIQESPGETIQFDSPTFSVTGGETAVISGKSNSPILSFVISEDSIGISEILTYTINGDFTVSNSIAIVDDPGATSEFTFELSLSIPTLEGEVTEEVERYATLTVTGEGISTSCSILMIESTEDI